MAATPSDDRGTDPCARRRRYSCAIRGAERHLKSGSKTRAWCTHRAGADSALRPDRVPDGLELDEVPDFVDALGAIRGPVDIRLAHLYTLHTVGSAAPQRGCVIARCDGIDSTNVGMRREGRNQLLPVAGDDVDDTARWIGRRQH